jgi:hypothetical protein
MIVNFLEQHILLWKLLGLALCPMLEVGEILQHQMECFLVSLQQQIECFPVSLQHRMLAGKSLQPQMLAGNSLWQQIDLGLHSSVKFLMVTKLAIKLAIS